jgi:hypothetical protein
MVGREEGDATVVAENANGEKTVSEVRDVMRDSSWRLGALLAGACFRVWNCWWFHQVDVTRIGFEVGRRSLLG